MTPADHDRAVEGYGPELCRSVSRDLERTAWRDWDGERLAAINRRIKKLKEEKQQS